jgi:C-terminal processing protease CtpA/Prc
MRDIAKNLLRGDTPGVKIAFIRTEKRDTLVLSRYPSDRMDLTADWSWSRPDSCYRLINKEVGYINLVNIRTSKLEDIFRLFRDKKGIIIDIRNYPAEFVVFSLGKYLMPEPVEFVKFTRPVINYPGIFEWQDAPAVGEENPDYYRGRVIILVNEITQSQAEYTAMALRQAPRALVLGSTTAGADGNVSRIFFPGNILTMISGIGVYWPDGGETQRIGIVPDIELRPTVEGIREGRDEILKKAVDLIENGDI